jgi:hypothetical protein
MSKIECTSTFQKGKCDLQAWEFGGIMPWDTGTTKLGSGQKNSACLITVSEYIRRKGLYYKCFLWSDSGSASYERKQWPWLSLGAEIQWCSRFKFSTWKWKRLLLQPKLLTFDIGFCHRKTHTFTLYSPVINITWETCVMPGTALIREVRGDQDKNCRETACALLSMVGC